MKNIISWGIGIIVGIIVLRVIFWIFSFALSVIGFLILAAGVYFVASFVHKLIYNKFLNR
jgi:hypothetical protein